MFDTKRFLLENFGDSSSVINRLRKVSSSTPPKDTVNKWFQRGSIPGKWWPILFAAIPKKKVNNIQLSNYIQKDDVNDVFS